MTALQAIHPRAAVALSTLLLIAAALLPASASAQPAGNGVVSVKSAHPMAETIARIKKDVAAKGITFFQEIDQADLAAKANIHIRPSVLLVFGNPPLGTLFIQSNPAAGLDWPVRVLVYQDADGQVQVAYNDFAWIAQRHGIRGEAAKNFDTATGVIGSITSTIR